MILGMRFLRFAASTLFVTFLCWSASPQPPKYPTKFSSSLAADPKIVSAFSSLEAREEQLITEWIRVTEIPAPSGKEHDRAVYVKRELEKLKLHSIQTDEAGNVSGQTKKRGTTGGLR